MIKQTITFLFLLITSVSLAQVDQEELERKKAKLLKEIQEKEAQLQSVRSLLRNLVNPWSEFG